MSTPAPKSTSRRYRLPILTAILAVAGLLYVHLKPEMEQNFKGWLTSIIILFALLVTSLWFVLLSGFSGRVRLLVAVALALAFVGFKTLLRVDGSLDGRGLPHYVWKWTPPRGAALPLPPAAVPATPADVPAPPGVADVPQFFGPNRDGVIRGANLARDWSAAAPKQLWRQPIGIGWSAFSVAGGRAFTQEQRGGDELVTCYELATGRLL